MKGSMPRVGVIMHRGRDALFNGFVCSLAARGYVDGQNIALEPRFAEGVLERTSGFAEDLLARKVDLIVAIGAVGARAAQRATCRIPIVYSIVLDPVEMGFAASLDRHACNMAGVTNHDPDLAGKQFTLLKQLVPDLKRIAILSDVDIPRPHGWNTLERSNATAATALQIELQWVRVKGPALDRAATFRAMAQGRAQAVQVLEVPVLIANFNAIAAMGIEHRLPSMFPGGWQHDGLVAYGTSLLQTVPELARLVDLVLRGADPAELPVSIVRAHRLRLNLETARRIGLEVSPDLVAKADEVVGVEDSPS